MQRRFRRTREFCPDASQGWQRRQASDLKSSEANLECAPERTQHLASASRALQELPGSNSGCTEPCKPLIEVRKTRNVVTKGLIRPRFARDDVEYISLKLQVSQLITANEDAKQKDPKASATDVDFMSTEIPRGGISAAAAAPPPNQSRPLRYNEHTMMSMAAPPAHDGGGSDRAIHSKGVESQPFLGHHHNQQDQLLMHLTKCAEAVSRLGAEVQVAFYRWRLEHQYKRQCLMPAFQTARQVVQQLAIYEMEIDFDSDSSLCQLGRGQQWDKSGEGGRELVKEVNTESRRHVRDEEWTGDEKVARISIRESSAGTGSPPPQSIVSNSRSSVSGSQDKPHPSAEFVTRTSLGSSLGAGYPHASSYASYDVTGPSYAKMAGVGPAGLGMDAQGENIMENAEPPFHFHSGLTLGPGSEAEANAPDLTAVDELLRKWTTVPV